MRYRVRAVSADSVVVETELEAAGEVELRALMTARGLSLLSWRELGVARGRTRFPLNLFNQELLSLLRAGIALSEALDALAQKEVRRSVRVCLQDLRQALHEGRTLSNALERAPILFPPLYIAMIRAAEHTSELEQALARYIDYTEQVEGLRSKLISAAVYPCLLLGVGGLVVMFLLGYVVPRFSTIYEDIHGDLPWMSRLMLDWGRFMEANGLVVGAVTVALISGLVVVLRKSALWERLGRKLWSIPSIGRRLRNFQLARFYRMLGMLLTGGVSVVPALGMVAGLLPVQLQANLRLAMAGIREGQGFTASLAAAGLTTAVGHHMLLVGERAGNLGEMLLRSAEFHEETTAREVDLLTRLIGPSLMLIIGGVIGLIVVLMYLPIFQIADSIR